MRTHALLHLLPQSPTACMPGMQTQEWFFRNHVQEITNVTVGSFLWAGLVVGEVLYVRRIMAATKSGKRWCVMT